jgi:hypothetical protein
MNDLTPAQKLAMLANSPGGEQPFQPPVKAMGIRLPFDLLSAIDALGSVTGVQSRNALMVSLLQAGVHSVVQELDDSEQYEAALEHFQERYSEQQEQE